MSTETMKISKWTWGSVGKCYNYNFVFCSGRGCIPFPHPLPVYSVIPAPKFLYHVGFLGARELNGSYSRKDRLNCMPWWRMHNDNYVVTRSWRKVKEFTRMWKLLTLYRAA